MAPVRNRAQFLQHFGWLPSSFSHTYLRHSVSAQADCCPDVVELLFCTAAPFITANVQSPSSICPAYLGRILLFWPSTYTVPSLLLGYIRLLNQAPVSLFLKPVLKKLELQTFKKHYYSSLSLSFFLSLFFTCQCSYIFTLQVLLNWHVGGSELWTLCRRCERGRGEDVVQTDKAIWFCYGLSALPR